MATADAISAELMCPICHEELKQPKVVGPCLHTVCRRCIEEYITTNNYSNKFPCPVSREECILPPNGVDGLKDHFLVANIIQAHRNRRKRPVPLSVDSKCSLCRNKAVKVCETCNCINLCFQCGLKHGQDHSSRDHAVFDLSCLCSRHQRPQSLYCRGCKQSLCHACKMIDHGDHDVTPLRDLIANSSAELEKAISRVEVKEKDMSALCESVHRAAESASSSIEKQINDKRDAMKNIRAKIDELQKEMEQLEKKKSEEEKRHRKCQKIVEKLEMQKSGTRSQVMQNSERIDRCLSSLGSRKTELSSKLQQCRASLSGGITGDVVKNQQGYIDLAARSNDVDTASLITEIRKRLGDIELDEGRIRPIPQPPGRLYVTAPWS